MRLFGTKKCDYYSLFRMEEKGEKYCPKIFGTEEVLKTQFYNAKETKMEEMSALLYWEWRKII